ncbi:MAG: methyltransferase domain-containing protein, partial [Chloroflexia bacterium]|nr:methyltransferase domain-containing protein [Chloroflexia bacterium]
MNIQNIIDYTKQPGLYEKGNAQMWTDEHISKQLLQVHLNEDVDLASRKMSTIETTIDWILQHSQNKPLRILDLGCGPGLYSEKLAKNSHEVTGVDFSNSSINYAKAQAK